MGAKVVNATKNSIYKKGDVWGYPSSWLYLYQLEARRRDLMHINWSPQAGLLQESCQISHLDFIRPLNWTASKTDKLDLLLTSTAVSFTHRCFNFQSSVSSTHIYWCFIWQAIIFIYKEDPANLPYSKPWGVVLCVWAAEKNIIDCRHLNERLWIKVIAAQCTVACVGNGWGRIIRHEYSAKHSRSPVFTGQSSSNVWQSSGAGNPSSKSVEKSDVEIHWKMCQEIWYRCLLSGEIGEIQ